MAHPLHVLARRLEKTTAERRSKRAMSDAITDPHLARGVGLPYQPRPTPRIDRW